ncbi:MAG: penicillin-binding protein activator [Magnetococcales bacterium]|nr:penicillin-binding protein activator [Magnetococcales bacterium]
MTDSAKKNHTLSHGARRLLIGLILLAWLTPLPAHADPVATWHNLIQEILAAPEPTRGKTTLHRIPPAPVAPEEIRAVHLALEPLDKEELQLLLQRQPATSPLAPFLHLFLGDRAAAEGQESEAQTLWKKAAGHPQINAEAQRRLTSDQKDQPGLTAGLMVPMSGASAAMGNTLVMAARKALADHRDVQIRLEVIDSGGSAATAKSAVENLVARGVQVIVGPVFHPEAVAAAKAAKTAHIPILPLNPRAEISEVGGAIHLNAFHPDAQARVMARHAIKKGLKRFAILAADTDYGQLQAQTFANEVVALGGIVARSILFPEQETDFTTALKMLVNLEPEAAKGRLAAARSAMLLDPLDRPAPRSEKELEALLDFDALFLPATAKQVRMIAPQAALFQIRSPAITLLGSSLWNRPELLEEAELLTGATFCDIDMDQREQFATVHRKVLGTAPIPALSMLVYDGIAILAQLLRDQRLGGPEWTHGLTRDSGFHGSAGFVRFLPNGTSERYYHLYRIQEKKILLLDQPAQTGAPDPGQMNHSSAATPDDGMRLHPVDEPAGHDAMPSTSSDAVNTPLPISRE